MNARRAPPSVRKVSAASIVLTSCALDLKFLADQLDARAERALAKRVRRLCARAHALALDVKNLRSFQ